MSFSSEKNGIRQKGDENIAVINVVGQINPINKETSFEEALEIIGFGRVQVKLLLMVSLLLMTVINETMGVSFYIPAAQCDLDLSTGDKGLLTGMTFLGIFVSSYLWGYLADTKGRKLIILISLSFATISSCISAFVGSFTLFVICRFISGFFVGGFSATSYAYLGEFNILKYRGTIISWSAVAIGLAYIFGPLSALWILGYEWRFELYEGYEFRPWRLVILIYVIPGVVGGLWMTQFPESPKFLLTQNREEEALVIVRWIYRMNKGRDNHDEFGVTKLKSEAGEAHGKNYKGVKAIVMSLVNQTFPLFKPPYALHFFACSFLHLGTFSVAGGMAMFLPEVLNRLSKRSSLEGSDDLRVCDVLQLNNGDEQIKNNSMTGDYICDDSVDSSVFVDSAYIGCGMLIGFVALSLVIGKLGRRKIFVFCLLTSAISGILLTVVTAHYLIIFLFLTFILFSGLNVSLINGAAVDIFPTHLRAMAVCVAMLFGRLGSAVSTNLIGYLLERNCELTFYVFSSIVFACFAVSFIVPG